MIYASRRERIAAEKLQLRGRRMRSMKVGVASFATFAGVTVAGVAPASREPHRRKRRHPQRHRRSEQRCHSVRPHGSKRTLVAHHLPGPAPVLLGQLQLR